MDFQSAYDGNQAAPQLVNDDGWIPYCLPCIVQKIMGGSMK
jgi:hypothetical protein